MNSRAMLQRKLDSVRERIEAAAARSGRSAQEITLVAVTKTVPAQVVAEAWRLGVRHFGENRVEEGLSKIQEVSELLEGEPEAPVWHMVGHIQSRKTSDVAQAFTVVESVDRVKIVDRLERYAAVSAKRIGCFLEINTSGEGSKYGLPGVKGPESHAEARSVLAAAEALAAAPHLDADGLMTIGPLGAGPDEIRACFRTLGRWRDFLRREVPGGTWTHLSMGMTDDFEIGIEEGATVVRIGRAIFEGVY